MFHMGQEFLNFAHVKKLIIAIVMATVGIAAAVWLYATKTYRGPQVWVYLPQGTTAEAMGDSIGAKTSEAFGRRVAAIYRLTQKSAPHGAYLIDGNAVAWREARRIGQGRQTPVRITFNNLRTFAQLARRLDDRLEMTDSGFIAAADSIYTAAGFKKEEYPAAVLPDTYEFYWTATPGDVAHRLLTVRNAFWTDRRRQQAASLGLTPVQVATVASIVEEESNNRAERPVIARLYLNRLQRGMPLQADPTVKFALNDFTLRRIRSAHIAVDSPYNTYRNKGLPPGPIRIVEAQTIQGVLDSKPHDYLYMCAKEDFSGTHNFATDYSQHLQNARRYQAALNRRNF